MNQDHRIIIICGLPRSGTTYLGKIISKTCACRVIHEPLNKDFGVKGIPQWYPYLENESQKNRSGTKKAIRDIIDFKAKWTHRIPPGYSLFSRVSKYVYGGRSGAIWTLSRYQYLLGYSLKKICFKDPFLTFALDYFINTYQAKAVCLVRHPCALYLSYRRQNIPVNLDDLHGHPDFRARYAADIPSDMWKKAKQNKAIRIALLWKTMARMISSQEKRLKNLTVIRHEELCLEPVETVKKVCGFCDLPFNSRMQKFINKTSHSHRILPKKRKFHTFNRNSSALKDAWRRTISPEEEYALQKAIGDDIYLMYQNW